MRDPGLNSLQARLWNRVERAPDQPALAFYDAAGVGQWSTFGDLHARAVATARRLGEEGVKQGDTCIIVLPSGEPSALLVMGALLAGAVPLLVAPPSLLGPSSNLIRVLEHTAKQTGASLIVADDSLGLPQGALLAGSEGRVALAADLIAEQPEDVFAPILPDETDVAAMQLTSGTTGFPRICVWDHRGVLAAIEGMRQAMLLTTEDVCFNWTPLYHDMGLVNNFLLSMIEGVPLTMMSPHDFAADPTMWLLGLADSGATITWSPNFGYALAAQRAREDALDGVRLDRVRAFWNAAERIHLDTMLGFHQKFSPYGVSLGALKTNFGCAENVGGATFSDPEGRFVVEHVDQGLLADHRVAEPVRSDAGAAVVGVGRPYPGMRVAILSDEGETLPDGVVGEIALDSPSRMKGYLGNDDATRQAVGDGHLRTGDLGYLRNGELFWVGRVRERITVSGKKYDPSDFEASLLSVSDLRAGRFAAFGVDDETQGTQRLVIVSEVREPPPPDLEQLRKEIRRRVFSGVGVNVGDVVLVRSGTLTKTSSGKRRHTHFRAMYLDGKLEPLTADNVGAP